jgi:hypothetical protein
LLDLVEEGRLTFQGKSDGESPFGALKGFLEMRYRWPAPSSHPAESPFSGKLLNAAGATAAQLSNQRNAALSRARAAKYPHPGILSLRHLPSHCDERLAHEYDIGRGA